MSTIKRMRVPLPDGMSCKTVRVNKTNILYAGQTPVAVEIEIEADFKREAQEGTEKKSGTQARSVDG